MKKILIIGESARDIFVYCNADRLAPDLPIPVLSIIEQKDSPGMAKNVERNVKSLMDDCDIVTNPGWEQVTKTRYMHRNSNHAFLRVDTDNRMKRIDVTQVPLEYEIVAISDYNKGFLTEDDIKSICEHHDKVFIDTKKVLGDWAAGAKYIKINNYEYERSKPYISHALEQKIITTKGEEGATFMGKRYPVAKKVEVKDTSGAGDSFFAALLVNYAETGDIEQAITFANECASEVVQHKGVTVITKPK
jgi:D-beta-D-heptose 7-phosphate kinase/D-beta-D-heptose 1-phosphate adenosyltransferase